MSTQYDEPYLDEFDDEPDGPYLDKYDELTDDERATAFGLLHGPQPDDERDPLGFYATPVTRRRKPDAKKRAVVDVLPSL
jgi:hypothetical protein